MYTPSSADIIFAAQLTILGLSYVAYTKRKAIIASFLLAFVLSSSFVVDIFRDHRVESITNNALVLLLVWGFFFPTSIEQGRYRIAKETHTEYAPPKSWYGRNVLSPLAPKLWRYGVLTVLVFAWVIWRTFFIPYL